MKNCTCNKLFAEGKNCSELKFPKFKNSPKKWNFYPPEMLNSVPNLFFFLLRMTRKDLVEDLFSFEYQRKSENP